MVKTMTKNFFDRQQGYSLIEVVIALAIFSIGILAIAQLQFSAVRNNTNGNLATQATMLAEAQIENLKNTNNVTLLADSVEAKIDHSGASGGIYTRTTTITNPMGGDFSRQIQVTVQWVRNGRFRQVVLKTLTQGGGI
jgi:prepilin-type N-terminal cleavage/methylation domain-containing protein